MSLQEKIMDAMKTAMKTKDTQSLEALKELLGIGTTLSGYLLIYNGLDSNWRKVKVRPDPKCPLCGATPSITDLSGHSE